MKIIRFILSVVSFIEKVMDTIGKTLKKITSAVKKSIKFVSDKLNKFINSIYGRVYFYVTIIAVLVFATIGKGNFTNFLFVLIMTIIFYYAYTIARGERNCCELSAYDFFIPLFAILLGMIHFNIYNKYVWEKTGNTYQKAQTVMFNPTFWKGPDIIIRDREFNSCPMDDPEKPITIFLKKGNFHIPIIMRKVSLSRKTWEVFNFDEEELRNFLKKDIEKQITESFAPEDYEEIKNWVLEFSYDGKQCTGTRFY